MTVLGLSPAAVLRLVRESRDGDRPAGPLLVVGPLAPQLARELADGGDAGLVRTAGHPAGVSALVCVLGGGPTPEQVSQLRSATRHGIPTVAVQTGDPETRVPYVMREDIVPCPPGAGFPVDQIAAAIVRGLGREAAPLAAKLPVLRPAARHELAVRGAGLAAGLAVVPWRHDADLPLLVLLQARLLRDLDVVAGHPAPSAHQDVAAAVGPELGAALGLGIAARSFVRSLPLRGRLVDAAVAGGATLGLATAAARVRP